MTSNVVDILYKDEAKKKILSGINQLAKVVGVTLGPQGKNVIIEYGTQGNHKITKDGVTVAGNIYLSDPLENIGAQLIKTVSQKTGNFIGDGTTSSAVLTQSMCGRAYALLESGSNAVDLKKGLDYGVEEFLKLLDAYCVKIDDSDPNNDIYKIANISSNYDELVATKLAEAFRTVGKEGVIIVDKDIHTAEMTDNMELQLIEGYRIDRGYVHPLFINVPERNRVELNNCKVLIIHHELNNTGYIINLLTECANGSQPVLIIADDITGELLNSLIQNKMSGKIVCGAVKSPSIGEDLAQTLDDIAILTGAEVVKDPDGRLRKQVPIGVCGEAERVIITRTDCTIFGGKGDPIRIEERIKSISNDIEGGKLTPMQKVEFKGRRAKMRGKIAMIKVAGHTDTDLSEKLDRVDDAIHAIKSAITYGYVPGGGATLLRISDTLASNNAPELTERSADFQAGYNVFLNALKSPIEQIMFNASGHKDHTNAIAQIKDHNLAQNSTWGFNANTGNVEDMIASNIIDPYEVAKYSVVDAASVAGLFITTDAAIINKRTDAQEALRGLLLKDFQE